MKKLIFGVVVCSISSLCTAQSKIDIRQVYYGGICMDNALCGYWLFQPDSTFAFISFSGKYIRYIGTGTYSLSKPGRASFTFRQTVPAVPQNLVVEYESGHVPGDSIRVSGRIESDTSTSNFAIVVLSDGHNTILRTDGTFAMVFPKKKTVAWMIVANRLQGFPSIDVALDTAANAHRFRIFWKPNDSTNASPAFHPVPFFGAPLSSPSLELA